MFVFEIMAIEIEYKYGIDTYVESIFVLRQQIEQRFQMHSHKKAQLLLITGGLAILQTKEKDYYIPINHFIWIPKNFFHNLKFTANNLELINIYFPDEDHYRSPFYAELGIYPVSSLLTEMLKFTKDWQGHYFKGAWEYEFMSALKHMLPHEELPSFNLQLPTTENHKVSPILEFIWNNLHEPLTLHHTSRAFALSERSLTRLFKDILGISVIQYVKMARIIKALHLLADKQLNISSISYSVGFSNNSAFSVAFKQLTNLSPSEYRLMVIK